MLTRRVAAGSVFVALLLGLALDGSAATAATLQGRLSIGHADDFAHGRSIPFANLETKGGYTVRLHFKGRAMRSMAKRVKAGDASLAGAKVQATGHRRRGALVVDQARVTPRAVGSRSTVIPPGPRKTAVLLVNFQGAARKPFSVKTLRDRIFTGKKSASAYLREVSNGRNWLAGLSSDSGDVFDWQSVARRSPDQPNEPCPVDYWARQALAATKLKGYDHYIFAMSEMPCPPLGQADIGGKRVWLNGGKGLVSVNHELGHNLGFEHANGLHCNEGGAAAPISLNCRTTEYEDPYDAMGSNNLTAASTRHYNSINLSDVGLLTGGSQTITQDGTYTLYPSEPGAAAGPQALRVPRISSVSGIAHNYLQLEYRQPYGLFDNFRPSSQVVKGVTARLSTPVDGHTNYGSVGTMLLDSTPQTGSIGDAPLMPGKTLTDSVAGISIKTESVTASSARVTVTGARPTAAATVSAARDYMIVSGAAGFSNSVEIRRAGDDVTVRDNAMSPGSNLNIQGCSRIDYRTAQCPAGQLEDIYVYLGDGNDSAIAFTDIATTVEGGAGDDLLLGGTNADTLRGDVGNDVIVGGANNDALIGGPGEDTLREGWPLTDSGDDFFDLRDESADNLQTCGADNDRVLADRDQIDSIGPACESVQLP